MSTQLEQTVQNFTENTSDTCIECGAPIPMPESDELDGVVNHKVCRHCAAYWDWLDLRIDDSKLGD